MLYIIKHVGSVSIATTTQNKLQRVDIASISTETTMEDEIKLVTIKKTQDLLGKYVKKPPLTEKLLKKPPFRFLHDIITSIIKDHGFYKGIFTEDELKSENIKDKENKIQFLFKAINTLKLLTNSDIKARPSKIVAGHEPTKTNEFLQAIGKALSKNLSTDTIVRQIIDENLDLSQDIKFKPNRSTSKTRPEKVTTKAVVSTRKSPDKQTKRTEPKKIVPSPRVSKDIITKTKEQVAKLEKVEKVQPDTALLAQINNESSMKSSKENINTNSIEPVIEPLIDTRSEVIEQPVKYVTQEKEFLPPKEEEPILLQSNILIETPHVPQKENIQRQPSARPHSSLRPPSVRPVSARPAAPRIRERTDVVFSPEKVVMLGKVNVIVENVDKQTKDDDVEDMVIVEMTSTMPEIILPQIEIPEVQPKGHLVAQILETQKVLLEEEAKPQLEIEWEEDSQRNRESKKRYIDNIRNKIQTITRAALPLGQIINFLQEDYDNITRELQMWRLNNKKLSENINQQRAIADRNLEPMLKQYNEMEEDVEKQSERNNILKSEIYNTQKKIDRLMTRLM